MHKKAIIIGAGQIGRGFIGQILADSGYSVVFMDIIEELVNQINIAGEYQVIVLGEENHPQIVSGVRAVSSVSKDASFEFVDADIIATACGPNIIQKIAPLVADGIRRRITYGGTAPLNVIACENMANGTDRLRECIYQLLDSDDIAYCHENVGFPNCEVSRIVVPSGNLPPLAVKVEKYLEWIVEREKAKGDLSHIRGLALSDNVEAYVARKMFSLAGHAMLGYMGYAAGHQYVWEAVYDYGVFKCVYGALEECGRAWSMKYNLPSSEFMEYSTLMLIRFADQRVMDPVTRPAREPIRKLSLSERFFLPALTAFEHDIDPANILDGIRSVCKYDYSGDPEAVRLQAMFREEGVPAALSKITGLSPEHPLIVTLN